MRFLGKCFGVEVGEYCYDHTLVKILVEDDGVWHQKEDFDSFWLDDLITQLLNAKQFIDNGGKE